jgi:hypothetical protein
MARRSSHGTSQTRPGRQPTGGEAAAVIRPNPVDPARTAAEVAGNLLIMPSQQRPRARHPRCRRHSAPDRGRVRESGRGDRRGRRHDLRRQQGPAVRLRRAPARRVRARCASAPRSHDLGTTIPVGPRRSSTSAAGFTVVVARAAQDPVPPSTIVHCRPVTMTGAFLDVVVRVDRSALRASREWGGWAKRPRQRSPTAEGSPRSDPSGLAELGTGAGLTTVRPWSALLRRSAYRQQRTRAPRAHRSAR